VRIIRGQIGVQVWDRVSYPIEAGVRAAILAKSYDQLSAQVWDQSYAQVKAQVRDGVAPVRRRIDALVKARIKGVE